LSNYREVERLYARLRPTASNRFAFAQNFAWSLLANGEPSEAARQQERARQVLEQQWSERGFRDVENLRLEAAISSALGEHGLAEAAAGEALELAESILPEGSPWAAGCRQTLAEVLLAGGSANEACELTQRAYEQAVESDGAEHPRTLSLLATWTRAAIAAGRREQAIGLANDLLESTASDSPLGDERRALLEQAEGLESRPESG